MYVAYLFQIVSIDGAVYAFCPINQCLWMQTAFRILFCLKIMLITNDY